MSSYFMCLLVVDSLAWQYMYRAPWICHGDKFHAFSPGSISTDPIGYATQKKLKQSAFFLSSPLSVAWRNVLRWMALDEMGWNDDDGLVGLRPYSRNPNCFLAMTHAFELNSATPPTHSPRKKGLSIVFKKSIFVFLGEGPINSVGSPAQREG